MPVAAPSASPRTLEGSVETYYAAVRQNLPGPALAGLTITDDLPWQFNPLTNALALGNADLDVETVTGWELGYKGTLGDKVYVTADAYINQLRNFVTDLLPGVNPNYPTYALTDEVNVPDELTALDARLALLGLPANHPLRAPIPLLLGGHAQLQQGTRIQGGNALATLPDGSRAIVLSYTNAGKVTERGIELGVGYQFTPEIRGDVSFTGFSFDVDESEQAAGDQLVPNTPSKKATFSDELRGAAGLRRQRHPAAGGRASVGGRHLPGLRAGERAAQRERGIPDQQLRPDPRDRDQPAGSAAVPAVRRVGDRPAGAGRGDGQLLTLVTFVTFVTLRFAQGDTFRQGDTLRFTAATRDPIRPPRKSAPASGGSQRLRARSARR